MKKEAYQIVLFYKYVEIEDPEQLRLDQLQLQQNLGMTGRSIVSHEGVNMTMEATQENMEKYLDTMRSDKRFADIDFKVSPGTGEAFPKLSIKVRSEIVSTNLGDEDVNPNECTGTHLTPQQTHDLIHGDEEVVLVDMRNDYEQQVGMFEGALDSGMRNFRDLPETAEKLKDLKDKKIITYCTGGVRCEKASGYLKKKGFKDVSQMDGGIVRYLEAFDGKDFNGRLYVFDQRVTMDPFGHHKVIGRCDRCGIHSEDYINCAYKPCNKHMICCSRCRVGEDKGFCDEQCEEKELATV